MKFSQGTLLQMQEKMDVFTWFKENTPDDSVVYSLGSDYDFLLPVYTNNKVYYNFYASIFIVSNKETEERWLIQHLFDTEMTSELLRLAQRDFWMNRFIDSYQSQESRKKIVSFLTSQTYVPGVMVADEYIDYMYAEWQRLSALPLEEALTRYELDYILLSKEYSNFSEAKSLLDTMKTAKFATDINGNLIYTFNQSE